MSSAAQTTLRLSSPLEHVFPRLTPEQIARIAAHGRRRRVEPGEILLEPGDSPRIFVITAGSVETVKVAGEGPMTAPTGTKVQAVVVLAADRIMEVSSRAIPLPIGSLLVAGEAPGHPA